MNAIKKAKKIEDIIFGERSNREKYLEHRGTQVDFSTALLELIDLEGPDYPGTEVGKSLYQFVRDELQARGINPQGLVFRSAINTTADFLHFTDGYFYLPEFPNHPVTVDAFYTDVESIMILRDSWIDAYAGDYYSNETFQSDLFRYKKGVMAWKYNNGPGPTALEIFWGIPHDFRQHNDCQRPENHFILTQRDLSTARRMRAFAKLVAGCFAKAAGIPPAKKKP